MQFCLRPQRALHFERMAIAAITESIAGSWTRLILLRMPLDLPPMQIMRRSALLHAANRRQAMPIPKNPLSHREGGTWNAG
jgi:hypothetical protein